VRQYTAKNRLARTLQAINEACRVMRHESLPEQHAKLSRMLRGHYAYFGITGNSQRLRRLHHEATRLWRKWLSRRSWKSSLSWAKFAGKILQVFPLPKPKVVHRYGTA
jgi:RNA-directed DNA polymerase